MKYKFRKPYPETETTTDGGVTPPADAPKTEATATTADDEPLRDEGKKALAAERARAKQLESQLKKYKDIDPEKYQALLDLEQKQQQAKAEAERQELEKKQEYEKALAANKQTYEEQLAAKDKEIAELKERLSIKDTNIAKKEVERAFMIAFDNAGGYTEDAVTLLASPDIGAWLKYDNDAGEVVVSNPKTGDRPTDDKGNYLSVKAWIETWKPQKLRFFKPQNVNSGAGTPPTKPGGARVETTSAGFDPKNFNFAQRMEAARAKKQAG